jgi:hypothetical protein
VHWSLRSGRQDPAVPRLLGRYRTTISGDGGAALVPFVFFCFLLFLLFLFVPLCSSLFLFVPICSMSIFAIFPVPHFHHVFLFLALSLSFSSIHWFTPRFLALQTKHDIFPVYPTRIYSLLSGATAKSHGPGGFSPEVFGRPVERHKEGSLDARRGRLGSPQGANACSSELNGRGKTLIPEAALAEMI